MATLFAGATAGLMLGRDAARAAMTKAPAAKSTDVKVETVAKGLNHPWGLQFLPDGRLLVTERPGAMRLVGRDGKLSAPLAGLPQIWANGQGGLLDVVLAPDFASSSLIAFAYAAPAGGLFGSGGTAVATARLALSGDGGRLENVVPIFKQDPTYSGGLHFGCRLVFGRDGTLFITLGDRGRQDGAQELGSHIGKVLRVNLDGSAPRDNPFVGQKDKRPEIWSYGHRNIQGAALHPETGKLWVVEHGPRGGDEVNVAEKGKNYGWPVIGYGVNYSGTRIHDAESRDGMEQPIYFWRPSIAPSGMAFYASNRIPEWRGNAFVGALAAQSLHRLVLDGEKIVGEEVMLKDRVGRIRDVRQAPDGAIILLTDDASGGVLRVTAATATGK